MLCIGKAGQDVFLQGDVFTPLCKEGVCFAHIELGQKFYVDDAIVATGNNALNASVTFARQGLETHFIGVVGDDPAGHMVINALDAEHIDTTALSIDKTAKTSFSTVLLAPNGERTILDYPGTAHLDEKSFDFKHLNKDWLYVSSVGSMKLLRKIMKTARDNEMNIAFNPSSFELKHIQECADLLEYITIFSVNKEEAKLFVEGETTKQLATALMESVQYVLVSDGPNGAVAGNGIELIESGMYENVPVIDRTGAGDAFTSGFVSQIAQGVSLADAIVFASANSTSVVGQIGANTAALKGKPKLHDMPLKIEKLTALVK